MNKAIKIISILVVLTLISALVYAHSGRTDSLGCHTCRTNCEKYGIEYGFYHRHNPVRPCFEEKEEEKEKPDQTTEEAVEEKLPEKKEDEKKEELPEEKPSTKEKIPEDSAVSNESEPISKPTQISNTNNPKDLHQVIYVTDGDTIKVNISGKIESVRLLGIDTPEVNGKTPTFFT